jgi:hypothetical protein
MQNLPITDAYGIQDSLSEKQTRRFSGFIEKPFLKKQDQA